MIILSWYLIGNVPCECDFFIEFRTGGKKRQVICVAGRVKFPNCEYLLLVSSGESTYETQLQKQTSDSVNDRRCFHGKTKVYLTSTSVQN